MYRRICLFVLFMCVCRSQGQSEGQSCLNVKAGAMGVCKLISNCPAAQEELRRRIIPQTCSFIGTDPVVCCVEPYAPTNPPALPTTTTTSRPVATTQKQRPLSSTTEYVPQVYDYIELEPAPTCAPISANQTAPRTGQKAWDKCIEYQEAYVYPCERGPSGAPVRMSNCKHKANQLVVGGVDAAESEFPHMALLGFGADEKDISWLCGGSVISDKFILTAGHCTFVQRLGPISYALLGALKRSDDYDKTNLYKIRQIYKHPDYAPPQRYNDIALLETERSIRLYLKVIPACLDLGYQMEAEAWATGWGATTNRGSNADTLQKVKLQRFTDDECFKAVRPDRLMRRGIDTKTQICYGDKLESKDTCQGDSGGPMQIEHKRINCMYVIVGVTSFGRQCGVIGQPGIYTRVLEYVPWIESIVWP